ncbi:hypothetical protein SNEBB_010338 [Seison nebaliae]|nr:hypothetical protein SNEBB_010338 [Seison nebaliae]
MHIKSIRMVGFKSYEKVTNIEKFSPVFNAISGLNGTGKSNILDAICFLLGITDTKLLRVNHMKELIHQHGLGNVREATVSIVFDNTEKSQSPQDMEQMDEITITRQINVEGKSRLLVNGLIWTSQKSKKMFESIHLNTSNPHFIILQGKITQVLNMSSQQIWLMIEDALGAKFFTHFSKKADGLCNKKIEDADEITCDFSSDMEPILTECHRKKQLRKEYFQNYEKMKIVEGQQKILIYLIARQGERYSKDMRKMMKEVSTTLKEKYESEKENLPIFHNNEFNELRNCQMKFENYEKTIKDLDMELNKNEDKMIPIRHHFTSMEEQLDKIKESLKNVENELIEMNNRIEKTNENYENKKKEIVEKRGKLSASVVTLNELENGMNVIVGGDNCSRSIQSEIIRQKELIDRLKTDIEQMNERLNYSTQEEKRIRERLTNVVQNGEYHKKREETNRLKDEIEKLKRNDEKMEGEDVGNIVDLDGVRRNKRELEKRIWNFKMKHYQLDFTYRNVEENDNFDPKLIYGIVAKLLEVKDENHMIALGVCGGGRLFNVVVDNENVASFLLEKNRLPRMTTFLPINRMHGTIIPMNQINNLKKKFGSDGIWRAIDLVKYDEKYETVMQYLLGKKIVCETSELAMKCFGSGMKNCVFVTLLGDEYNPAGTLTGGMRRNDSNILKLVKELMEMEKELEKVSLELTNGEKKEKEVQELNEKKRNRLNELKNKESELKLIEVQLFVDEEKILSEKLKEIGKEILEVKKLKENEYNEKKLNKCENRLKELISTNNNEISIEERKGKLKKNIEKLNKEVIEKENELDEYSDELHFLKNSIEELKNKKISLEEKFKENEIELKKVKEEYETQEKLINKIGEKIDDVRSCQIEINKEIDELTKLRKIFEKEIFNKQEKLKEMKKELEDIEKNEMKLKIIYDQLISIQKTLKKKEKATDNTEKNYFIDFNEFDDDDDNLSKVFHSDTKKVPGNIPENLTSIILNDEILVNNHKLSRPLFEGIRTMLWMYQDEYDNNGVNLIDKDIDQYGDGDNSTLIYRYAQQLNWMNEESLQISDRLKVLERHADVEQDITNTDEGNMMKISEKIISVSSDYKRTQYIINRLNNKKMKEMRMALSSINQHLNAIFGSLIKHGCCYLEPEDDNDFRAGLKIVITLSNYRMESLSELSGGQRSLVALSLILAIQRFTPAPIYILDEIDAALDLSHTANIGHMIKSNFPGAQFIIVSLKEQMFNNAEVCFKTSFSNGNSSVQRIDNR